MNTYAECNSLHCTQGSAVDSAHLGRRLYLVRQAHRSPRPLECTTHDEKQAPEAQGEPPFPVRLSASSVSTVESWIRFCTSEQATAAGCEHQPSQGASVVSAAPAQIRRRSQVPHIVCCHSLNQLTQTSGVWLSEFSAVVFDSLVDSAHCACATIPSPILSESRHHASLITCRFTRRPSRGGTVRRLRRCSRRRSCLPPPPPSAPSRCCAAAQSQQSPPTGSRTSVASL